MTDDKVVDIALSVGVLLLSFFGWLDGKHITDLLQRVRNLEDKARK